MIIEKAKLFFNKEIEKSYLADSFKIHIAEFEKWVDRVLCEYPEADREIILLSMWLHDAGYPAEGNDGDHAVIGEEMAKKWLSNEEYDPARTERVSHCVRAHRCRDVMPETLEAKIVAFSDSASHMTQGVYFEIAKKEKEGKKYDALQKIERDWRDLSLFPEIKEEMKELYESWKRLIEVYRKTNI